MKDGTALAMAAGGFVGTRFRLQGRDPATGLDCIGLVLASLARIGVRVQWPADYRPRRRKIAIPRAALDSAGLVEAGGPERIGDVLLLRPAPAQAHLAILVGPGTIVHTHAGLGRVVRNPVCTDWPLLGRWRLDPDTQTGGNTAWPR